MSWLLKSLLTHNFCSKLCCCHLINLRACAPGVKLPSLSRDLTGLYMWGHSPSNAKRCKPLLFFPARWLFELWRFNDYVWGDGVKSRNNILITSKRRYFPRITCYYYFFTDSSFLDSVTVSGKGSGDLILSLSSCISMKWHKARTLFLSSSCQILSMARFYFPLLCWTWRFYFILFYFSFNVSLGIFIKEQGRLQICTGQEHLPVIERQRERSPPASVETTPCVAVVADLQHPLRGIQGGEWDTLCSRKTGGTGLQIDNFRNSLHDSDPCSSSYLENH